MPTDQYIYQSKELRDLAFETEKARGTKGVTKFTDQVNGKMVYILAVPVPVSPQTRNVTKSDNESLIAQNAALELTSVPESDNMTSEGNPNV